MERYDTERQTWEMVSPIKIARSALSLTVLDGKLYAMGGYDGQNFLVIVEVYDPEVDEWIEGTPLTSGRSGHASAVIYQPSNVNPIMDYRRTSNAKDSDHSSDPDNDRSSGPDRSPLAMYCHNRANVLSHSGSSSGASCSSSNHSLKSYKITWTCVVFLILKLYLHYIIATIKCVMSMNALIVIQLLFKYSINLFRQHAVAFGNIRNQNYHLCNVINAKCIASATKCILLAFFIYLTLLRCGAPNKMVSAALIL